MYAEFLIYLMVIKHPEWLEICGDSAEPQHHW